MSETLREGSCSQFSESWPRGCQADVKREKSRRSPGAPAWAKASILPLGKLRPVGAWSLVKLLSGSYQGRTVPPASRLSVLDCFCCLVHTLRLHKHTHSYTDMWHARGAHSEDWVSHSGPGILGAGGRSSVEPLPFPALE